MTVRRRAPHLQDAYRTQRQSIACARAVGAIGIDVRVSGQMPTAAGDLIVSNHLAMIDPFVIASRFQLVFSGKAEMMKWPVAGWVLRSIGLIPVHRGRRSRAASFKEEVADRLKRGLNVLAFPEGTTWGGTDVLPFKTGAFAAVELLGGVAGVVPITLRVVEVDSRAPTADTHRRFAWSDRNQSLAAHFWSVLGIRSTVIEIVVSERLAMTGQSRKMLADSAYEVVRRTSMSQALSIDGGHSLELRAR